jgi:MFS family permease
MRADANNAARAAIPGGVVALGFVSLFTDMSSEMVHSLLPVFMVGTLGASALMVGLVDGLAESLALVTKMFSGYISDRVGRRKPLVVLGYALATLTKPLFPLAGSVGWVLGARLLDRLGKGIRGAPRDALVADITPPQVRGAAYGLRQSMDTIGAVAGPLLAIALMLWLAGDIRAVLWFAVLPGVIAVAILVFAVREPERVGAAPTPRLPLSRAGMAALGSGYWRVVWVGALLTLARGTEAFLVLRASSLGMSDTWVPLVMVGMSLAFTVVAWPAGRWSDRTDRRHVLAAGLAVLLVADLMLALASGLPALMIGVALWGAHMGLTQGVFSALIADQAPGALRGTAFGMFNLLSGLSLLIAGVSAGALMDAHGAPAPFWLGASLALLALPLVRWLPAPKG